MFTTKPKVSVIIPTYNSCHYITQAIESILKQTYKDIEIIVVDDGSTDTTMEILNPYIKKSLIRYIYQEHSGPGAARNKGIRASRGEYICFLDADDVYLPDSVLIRVQFMEKFPQVGLVFTDLYLQDHPEQKILLPHLKKDINFSKKINSGGIEHGFVICPKGSYQLILPTCYPSTDTCMIGKRCLNVTGLFRTDISCAEDNDLWLRFAMNYPMAYINEVSAIYMRTRSKLCKPSEQFIKDTTVFLQDVNDRYNLDSKTEGLVKEKLYQSYFYLGYHYFDKADYKKSRRFLLQSIKRDSIWTRSILFYFITLLPNKIIRAIRELKRRIV